MVFLVRLLRVVLALLVVRLVLRAVAGFLRSRSAAREAPAPPAQPDPQGTELVRDRICNTFLPKARAVRGTIGGHEELFCSAACRDRALLLASRAS